jgi:hypothetical protein
MMKTNASRILLATIASVFLCIAIAHAQQTKDKGVKSDNGTTWILVEGGPTGDFYIAATEIIFDQFDEFCNATGFKKPEAPFGRGKQPVVNVNVADAVAYCKWQSKETGTTVRLPEENEWEEIEAKDIDIAGVMLSTRWHGIVRIPATKHTK